MKFSGRTFMVVATVSTYCVSIIGALILTLMKLLEVEVFLALFSGASGLVMFLAKAYFDDKSRPEDANKGV